MSVTESSLCEYEAGSPAKEAPKTPFKESTENWAEKRRQKGREEARCDSQDGSEPRAFRKVPTHPEEPQTAQVLTPFVKGLPAKISFTFLRRCGVCHSRSSFEV